jgi:hypothetical protein
MGAVSRLIESEGKEYTIRNASGGGGRDSPDYSDDGTLVGVIERRTRSASVETLSSGEEVESDLEIRAVYDSGSTTIREQGHSDGYPTKLVHPNGQTYEVVATFDEDAGVTILSVVRD